MKRRSRLLFGALLGAASLLLSLWLARRPGAVPAPRLVVLYAPCTVNRSFLSPYNPKVSYTPQLDAFARAGLTFTKHATEEGQSGIAYASLLSGNQAMRHGVYSHPARLNDSVYLITEAFRDAGYDVFFWADQEMASPELNYTQGVDPAKTFWAKRRVSAKTMEPFLRGDHPDLARLLLRLKRDPDYKVLAVTTFTVTHAPYRATYLEEFCRLQPSECERYSSEEIAHFTAIRDKHALGWRYAFETTVKDTGLGPNDIDKLLGISELLYKSNISYLDHLFGDLLRAIESAGLSAQSLVAFTADHGELLSKENVALKWGHGYMLEPEDILVPLILRGPGVRAGRYDAVTRSIDVFPTLASLAGIKLKPDSIMGVDLAAAVRGDREPPPLVALFHTSLFASPQSVAWFPDLSGPFPRNDPSEMWVGARDGDLVYKVTSADGLNFATQVYDWETDPNERHNLFDAADATQAAMVRRLADYKQALREGFSHWQAVAEGRVPSERQEELLRNLGYID